MERSKETWGQKIETLYLLTRQEEPESPREPTQTESNLETFEFQKTLLKKQGIRMFVKWSGGSSTSAMISWLQCHLVVGTFSHVVLFMF